MCGFEKCVMYDASLMDEVGVRGKLQSKDLECFSYMEGYRRGAGSKGKCLYAWKVLIQIKKKCLHKDGAVSGWRT